MKADKYYDITCISCAKSMSTDFGMGMARTAKQAHLWAKSIGFTNEGQCPEGAAIIRKSPTINCK